MPSELFIAVLVDHNRIVTYGGELKNGEHSSKDRGQRVLSGTL
jgi:hypothetical protein